MWIRSQLRFNLIPVTKQTMVCVDFVNDETSENLYFLSTSGTELGRYKSKERALEVLDEIQKYVVGKILIPEQRFEDRGVLETGTSNPYIEITDYKIEQLPLVYEMPIE